MVDIKQYKRSKHFQDNVDTPDHVLGTRLIKGKSLTTKSTNKKKRNKSERSGDDKENDDSDDKTPESSDYKILNHWLLIKFVFWRKES